MRDFLYSEISSASKIPNYPVNRDAALANGRVLCRELLEPLQHAFGRIHIRSAYRSPSVNHFGNVHKFNCANNENNFGGHIWDVSHKKFGAGATACVLIPSVMSRVKQYPEIWKELGCWIHDNIPFYSSVWFYKSYAFNFSWSEYAPKLIKMEGIPFFYHAEHHPKVEKFGEAAYPQIAQLLSERRAGF